MPWQGVRRADQFSASCIQNVVAGRKPWTYEFMTHGGISEYCLCLNVWTPAKSPAENGPFSMYLYGGGFNEGSEAVPVFDGEGLANKGLVMVTINYRVGVLGFLALPELTSESDHRASGNYGLLDQMTRRIRPSFSLRFSVWSIAERAPRSAKSTSQKAQPLPLP